MEEGREGWWAEKGGGDERRWATKTTMQHTLNVHLLHPLAGEQRLEVAVRQADDAHKAVVAARGQHGAVVGKGDARHAGHGGGASAC